MLEQWLRERDERKREERIEKNRKAAEEVEQWKAWYQRMQAAQQEGRPFDEPPPIAAKDNNGK